MESERASRWIRSSICNALSTITFLAISDAEEQNHQTIVFDLTDEPVIAHAIFPELPKPRAVQRLSDAARIVQLGYSVMKELQDALGLLRVEFAQFSINLSRELNVVGHDVSGRPSAGWSPLHRCGCVPAHLRPDTCPRDPPGVRGWLHVHSRSWCARSAGRASPGVFRWTAEAEWPA